jgi:hypothetical protein
MNQKPVDPFESLVADLMRSIVAGSRRCRAMREELLAHLRQAYEEELSLGADESAARQAAVRRFGDPADLQSQLQASVPSFERWLVSLIGSKEIVMSIGPRVAGWVMCLVGGAFMFGLAIVLPATAQLAQAVSPDSRSGRALDAAMTLKLSLTSLLAFSSLVTVVGLGILAYAFITRNKAARG